MSMIGNLTRIQNSTRERLHQSPELITAFLYPEMAHLVPKAKPGFLGRLFGRKEPPPEVPKPQTPPFEPRPQDDDMDLDKAWHGLHFVFTGSDWEGDFPQGFILTGGKPVGDVDLGYGPARSYSPDEVEKIAAFLETQNEADLRRRFDPKKMAELDIYPSIWKDMENPGEEWEYLADNFRSLKEFVKETAAKRMALLVYLN